jgi:hypothetical protein
MAAVGLGADHYKLELSTEGKPERAPYYSIKEIVVDLAIGWTRFLESSHAKLFRTRGKRDILLVKVLRLVLVSRYAPSYTRPRKSRLLANASTRTAAVATITLQILALRHLETRTSACPSHTKSRMAWATSSSAPRSRPSRRGTSRLSMGG